MRFRSTLTAVALVAAATPALAQGVAIQPTNGDTVVAAKAPADTGKTPADTAGQAKKKANKWASFVSPTTIQHVRPADERGINVFEAPKNDTVAYDGFKMSWGAAFTQEFQDLSHSNTAAAVTKTDANGKPYNANQLMRIGGGFNNAVANLFTNVQLAPGIRVALETSLSSRHHNEAWVKDGYIQIDQSPIDNPLLNSIMKDVTLKVGHFEINYGDEHFRRSDNGQSLYNPFVGNLILDAFTTEIGAEAYVRKGPFLAMGGVTGGEIHGDVIQPQKRMPAYEAKLGIDKQVSPLVRVRLTGSLFTQKSSENNTFYGGDRGGSPYFMVMENTQATTSANAWSGTVNPGFSKDVHAVMINPFVKVGGLELFGVAEQSKGGNAAETSDRTWHQYDVDAVYRLFGDKAYVGYRYNTAKGQLAGVTQDVSVNHTAFGAGWFVTPSLLLKGEYVNQTYNDFPTSDIRNGGQFKGFIMSGVVAF